MKIIITGAAGMLAYDVCKFLVSRNHTVIKTDINQREHDIEYLDVCKFDSVSECINKHTPDFIFHFAAETNVDLCEQRPEHAYRTNAMGTENVVLAASRHNIPLLYISTGLVFRGDNPDPYTEFDNPDPINVYAKSKYEGEKIVKDTLSRYFILRAGWMIGGLELDKKFVFKILGQLKDKKKEIFAVNDKFGSPTFTFDFAKNILPVISTERYGLYHMANVGVASRYDIAREMVHILMLEKDVKITPVHSAYFPLPAPRGRSEAIVNYKLNILGLNLMPRWESSLKKYLKESLINNGICKR